MVEEVYLLFDCDTKGSICLKLTEITREKPPRVLTHFRKKNIDEGEVLFYASIVYLDIYMRSIMSKEESFIYKYIYI